MTAARPLDAATVDVRSSILITSAAGASNVPACAVHPCAAGGCAGRLLQKEAVQCGKLLAAELQLLKAQRRQLAHRHLVLRLEGREMHRECLHCVR